MQNRLFDFDNHQLNVVINEANEPLFIAKDICDILDLKNPTQAMNQLDDDEKLTYVLDRSGQKRTVNLLTESGLYSLVLRSNKPEAKKFKKWITSEVLPSIRKHGAYITENKLDELLGNPDLIISLATQLKEERSEKERLLNQNQLQSEHIKLSAPKIAYHDQVLNSQSTYLTNQIAKELSMSATTLNRVLNDLKIQYKQNDTWLLYHKYQNQGFTKTKTYSFTGPDDSQRTNMTTVWTEKGRKFIHEQINSLQKNEKN